MGKIIKTVGQDEFVKAIVSDENNNMTFEGATILFDYLECVAEGIEENIEFDATDIRCQYSEGRLLDVLKEYDNIEDIEELQDACCFATTYENAAGETIVVYDSDF